MESTGNAVGKPLETKSNRKPWKVILVNNYSRLKVWKWQPHRSGSHGKQNPAGSHGNRSWSKFALEIVEVGNTSVGKPWETKSNRKPWEAILVKIRAWNFGSGSHLGRESTVINQNPAGSHGKPTLVKIRIWNFGSGSQLGQEAMGSKCRQTAMGSRPGQNSRLKFWKRQPLRLGSHGKQNPAGSHGKPSCSKFVLEVVEAADFSNS